MGATDGSEVNEPFELASSGRRLVAYLVDTALIFPFCFLVLTYSGAFELILKHQPIPPMMLVSQWVTFFVAYFAANSYLLLRKGQTVGKNLLGIRITDLKGHIPPFWKIVLLRWLPMYVVGYFGPLGKLLSITDSLTIFRNNRRCLHDVLAGTRVVRVTPSSQP